MEFSVRVPIYDAVTVMQVPSRSPSPAPSPIDPPSRFSPASADTAGAPPESNMTTWEMWDTIRTICGYNPRLTLSEYRSRSDCPVVRVVGEQNRKERGRDPRTDLVRGGGRSMGAIVKGLVAEMSAPLATRYSARPDPASAAIVDGAQPVAGGARAAPVAARLDVHRQREGVPRAAQGHAVVHPRHHEGECPPLPPHARSGGGGRVPGLAAPHSSGV